MSDSKPTIKTPIQLLIENEGNAIAPRHIDILIHEMRDYISRPRPEEFTDGVREGIKLCIDILNVKADKEAVDHYDAELGALSSGDAYVYEVASSFLKKCFKDILE